MWPVIVSVKRKLAFLSERFGWDLVVWSVTVIQTETRVPIGTLWAGLRSVVGHSHSNGNSRSYRNAMGGASGLRIFEKRYNLKTVQDRAVVTMADK